MKLDFAVLEAIRKSSGWVNGAVVVETADDEYEAYPGAYMNDVSFGGSRQVVLAVVDPSEVLGEAPEELELYSDEFLLDYISSEVLPHIG